MHLKMTNDGESKVHSVNELIDIVDSRVLCALVNSIVPNTFTADVLLNDRWTVNLALTTMSEMARCSNPFDAEDLVEADPMSVCAYFTFFFMAGYKLRQAQAALKRIEEVNVGMLRCQEEISKLPTGEESEKLRELEIRNSEFDTELRELNSNYDIEYCKQWIKDVLAIQQKAWSAVSDMVKKKFDIISVPRSITVNEFVENMMINLRLTSGSGFYEMNMKENISNDRKIVLYHYKKGMFFSNVSKKKGQTDIIRTLLRAKSGDVFCLDPCKFPEYQIFLESNSPNKMLKTGTLFLYQVFPDTNGHCEKLLQQSAKYGHIKTVQRLISFFGNDYNFINSAAEKTENTALHLACKFARRDVVEYLLESRAEINKCNSFGNTPFYAAIESNCIDIAKLLIEWGADIYKRNKSNKAPLEILKNAELRNELEAQFKSWRKVVPQITAGNSKIIDEIINLHTSKRKTLASLRSQSIDGCTLLHAASYLSNTNAVRALVTLGLDVDVTDCKGATPLQRARDSSTVQLLINLGADIHAVDQDGNTSLHLRCFGEPGRNTDDECILFLMEMGVDMFHKNSKGLLAIHCASMQGRLSAVKALIDFDVNKNMQQLISTEAQTIPPSPLYMAIANSHILIAEYLIEHGFKFKDKEADSLIEKIVMMELPCTESDRTFEILIAQGANVNATLGGGNSILHACAGTESLLPSMELLIKAC